MEPATGLSQVKDTDSAKQLQDPSQGNFEQVAPLALKAHELTKQVPQEWRDRISLYFPLVPITSCIGAASNLLFGSFSSCFSWGIDAVSTVGAVKSGRNFVNLSDTEWQDVVKGTFVLQTCKLGYNAAMLAYTRDFSYLLGAGVNALILVETANRLDEMGIDFKAKK